MTIPKILHFTWKTKTLPKFLGNLFEGWKDLHPDWDIRLYDDDDINALIRDNYPELVPVFKALPRQIFRVDAFRFAVLHRYGGIYSDLDVRPMRKLDPLVEKTACFVGVEPELDIKVNNARYLGMPFCLGNAFMGSEPGHVFWARCMSRLKDSTCADVVDATGPRYVNSIALTVPRDERPDALMPECWSPLSGTGRPAPTSPDYAKLLSRQFRVIGEDEAPYGSHLWRNSWAGPFVIKGVPEVWKLPTLIKWQYRRMANPRIVRTQWPSPRADYDDQDLHPADPTGALTIAVDLTALADIEALGTALTGLDVPKATRIAICGGAPDQRMALQVLLSVRYDSIVRIEAGGAAGRNRVLESAGAGPGAVLFVDGRLVAAPADAVLRLAASGRPVTTAWIADASGEDRNIHAFVVSGDLFKFLCRNGARSGALRDEVSGKERMRFNHFHALNVAPLTAAGSEFLRVENSVAAEGVRFAETPYKYGLDALGLCLMARDRGFEVAGMPGVKVRLGVGAAVA